MTNNCNNLFKLELVNDHFLYDWQPLYTCMPDNPRNCTPNVMTFLNIMSRETGQKYSKISETTGLYTPNILGTHHQFVTDYLNMVNKNNEIFFTAKIHPINNIEYDFINFFKKHLNPNEITIINVHYCEGNNKYVENQNIDIVNRCESIGGKGRGHTMTIAKTNNDKLIILDPQIQIYYIDDHINTIGIKDADYFIVYYICDSLNNKIKNIELENKKRKYSEIESPLRKQSDDYKAKRAKGINSNMIKFTGGKRNKSKKLKNKMKTPKSKKSKKVKNKYKNTKNKLKNQKK